MGVSVVNAIKNKKSSMKIFFSIFIATAFLFFGVSFINDVIVPTDASSVKSGYCGVDGDNLIWSLDATGTLTISGTGDMEDYDPDCDIYAPWSKLRVDALVVEEGVTSIGDFAFYSNKILESVHLSESVESIGEFAFTYCDLLLSVNFPDGVQTIGDWAFAFCYELESATIGNGVKVIGEHAFVWCKSLSDLTFGNSLEIIGDSAFFGCQSLSDVTVPNSVTTIGVEAFYRCDKLTNISLPFIGVSRNKYGADEVFGAIFGYTSNNESGTTCQYYRVNNYTSDYKYYYIPSSLKTVTITDDTSISWGAFYGCSNLTKISLSDNITRIDGKAFYNCTGLKNIVMPKSLTTIGEGAFYNCISLKDIVIPKTVTTIYTDAFNKCSNLNNVYIEDVSAWCKVSLSNQYANPIIVAKNVHFLDKDGTEIYDLVIDNTVYKISELTFNNCKNIKSIVIPKSVKSIALGAFSGCSSLESITIPFVGNSLKDSSSFPQYPFGYIFGSKYYEGSTSAIQTVRVDSTSETQNKWYYIPNSLKTVIVTGGEILDCAFVNCTSLTKVITPNSSVGIGFMAFSGCTGLTDVVIPDGVKTIGIGAFNECSNLRNIIIPESLESIDYSVFYNCISLETINIPSNVTKIDDSAFLKCTSLRGINVSPENEYFYSDDNGVLYDKYLSTLIYAPAGNNLSSYIIPDGVKIIKSTAFYDWYKITGVVMPKSIRTIGASAFANASELNSVLYKGTVEDKNKVTINSNNDYFANAFWHYEVEEDVFADRDCYYCPECDTYFLPNGDYAKATIIFKNWDGEVISYQSYKYGDEVDEPVTPSKPSDNTYTYTFAGWDKVVTNCVGNEVYTATYTKNYVDYTVEFKDWDGKVLSSQTYHYGDDITIPDNPYKAADNTYTYTFAGWDKEINDKCVENICYKATYNAKYIDYTITFKNWDGEVLSSQTYHYGDTVKQPAAPIKEKDDYYTYTFKGWNKQVTKCYGDAEYTAIFSATHYHNYKDEKVTNPTCIDKGYTTYKCACGSIYTDNYVDALGHAFNSYVSDNNATCTNDGTKTSKCDRCDATSTITDVGTKLEHNFSEWYTTVEPGCETTGEQRRTCLECDCYETRVVNATGHKYVSKVTAPTCEEKGYTTYTCKCNYSFKTNYTEALGHTFNNYISDNNATCTADGTKTSKCDRCDVTHTIADEGSMKEHSLGEWFITVEPKCTINGEQRRNCSNCEYFETKVAEALGHKWSSEYIIDKEPTYEEEGRKSIHCDRCDILKEDSIVSIPRLIAIKSVSLNKEKLTLIEGKSETLIVTINPEDTTDDKTLTWTSSDELVATVDQEGNVTAVSEGTATITVTTSNNISATCIITVNDGFPFKDVKKSKWYYSIVKEAFAAGLMSGTSETTFSPDDNMTRGMIVTVLHRIAGKPDAIPQSRFPDVGNKSYCAVAVEWAAKNKVVSGYSNGKFGPNDNITRQDVAVILYNYARSLGLDVTNDTDLSKFADYKNVSSYAKPAMQWAVSVGILGGSTDKATGKVSLNPKNNATRAECAKMLLVASKIYK